MRRISIIFAFVISFLNVFGQDAISDSLALAQYRDSIAQRQAYIDSLLAVKPLFALSPEYYKERYNGGDLTYKITDNKGDGFDALYGTRNLRPILYGVATEEVPIITTIRRTNVTTTILCRMMEFATFV